MLVDLTVKGLLEKTAGNDPVPGGGSISALNGALASALAEMVANLTMGRKKYEDKQELMERIAAQFAYLQKGFVTDIDADSDAYNKVFDAFKLPKDTDEEKSERSKAIQAATRIAADIPLEVARKAYGMMDMISQAALEGNQNAITDACVAMMCARTAVLGAALNVRINLSSLKDAEYVEVTKVELNRIEKDAMDKELSLYAKVKELI